MDKLLAYTPEPFAELNEWGQEEEIGRRRSARGAFRTTKAIPFRSATQRGSQRFRSTSPSLPSEHNRWVQDCLNRALGLQLAVNGVMNRETRSAVRLFQGRHRLPVSGLLGPDTEELLKTACKDNPAYSESEEEFCPLCSRRETMNEQLNYQSEFLWETLPLSYESEAEDNKFGNWQDEVVSMNTDRIRWIQGTLNKILGLSLKVDGVMGAQTRSAIRSFQQKQGLIVDGIVGQKTEQALIALSGTSSQSQQSSVIMPTEEITQADARLSGFDFNSSALKPPHQIEINKIADKIVASWKSGKPFFTVKVIGHTDPEGSANYNQGLGQRRALAVRTALQQALKNKQRDLYYKVLVLAASKGESERIDLANTPNGQAKNRRVEIFLSTKVLLPIKKPTPTPTPLLRKKCDVDDLNRRLSTCSQQIRECIAKCESEKNSIWNKIKDNVAFARCFTLKHPALIAACAIPLGGIAAKETIDEYFRLSNCQDYCNRMLDMCEHVAKVNSHCLNK